MSLNPTWPVAGQHWGRRNGLCLGLQPSVPGFLLGREKGNTFKCMCLYVCVCVTADTLLVTLVFLRLMRIVCSLVNLLVWCGCAQSPSSFKLALAWVREDTHADTGKANHAENVLVYPTITFKTAQIADKTACLAADTQTERKNQQEKQWRHWICPKS